MEKTNNCWIEVNLIAIKNNLKEVNKLLSNSVKIMVVVKTDAYGHGLEQLAKVYESENIDAYGIANVEEGIRLRKIGIKKPILILYETPKHKLEDALSHDLSLTIYDNNQLEEINDGAKKFSLKAKVHLLIETGMNWYGLSVNNSTKLARKIKANTNLELEGIYSHFSQADNKNENYTRNQLDIFDNLLKNLAKDNIRPKFKHIANSAGIINFPKSHLDLVRPGIVLYGAYPRDVDKEKIKLTPALSLKTKIMQVKKLKRGSQVSYGGTFTAKNDITIAVLPIGYSDGLSRKLSNSGEVIIGGKKYPIIGNVCMNITMVDITDCDDIKAGDIVTVLGEDGNSIITAEKIAEIRNTISYEVLTDIGNLNSKKRLYKDIINH
jgi:alanine racemase